MSGFSGSITQDMGEIRAHKNVNRPASRIQRPSAFHEVDACTQHAACWEEKASGFPRDSRWTMCWDIKVSQSINRQLKRWAKTPGK